MNNIYLHIGFGKTGTTSIQSIFEGLKLSSKIEIYIKGVSPLRNFFELIKLGEISAKKEEVIKKELSTFLNNQDIFYSDEFISDVFFNFENNHIQRILDYSNKLLKEINYDLKVILVNRNIDELVEKMIFQNIYTYPLEKRSWEHDNNYFFENEEFQKYYENQKKEFRIIKNCILNPKELQNLIDVGSIRSFCNENNIKIKIIDYEIGLEKCLDQILQTIGIEVKKDIKLRQLNKSSDNIKNLKKTILSFYFFSIDKERSIISFHYKMFFLLFINPLDFLKKILKKLQTIYLFNLFKSNFKK